MTMSIPPTQTAPEAAAPLAAKAAAAKPVAPAPEAPTTPAASKAIAKDIVTISAAAQTAVREARETPAQTAQEANHGDQQAVRLLAKETAAKRA